jgi:hypothetical protein
MAVSDAVHLAVSIAKILHEAYNTIEECKELAVKCLIVQIILEKNADKFGDDLSVQNLARQLRECNRYLYKRQTKSFFRNIVETTLFPKRIAGYKEQINQWISVATFSLVVCTQLDEVDLFRVT